MSPFLFRGYKSIHELYADSLGRLERDVLDVVWGAGEVSVRKVCAQLDRFVAYTTVMTTMDRLFKKGLLERKKAGRAFVYRAVVTKHELDALVAAELIRAALQQDGQGPLTFLSLLVDVVSAQDLALLDELEMLVRKKHQQEGKAAPS
jgi:predicted transcriptional regulator